MVMVNGRCETLYDVACRIYDANMMLRAIAELDVHQMAIPCWYQFNDRRNWRANAK